MDVFCIAVFEITRKHPWITTIDNYPVNLKDREYIRERYNPSKVSAPMVGVGGWKKVAHGPDGNLEKALLEAVKTQPVLAFIASESREFGGYIGDFLGTIIAGTVNIGVAWWLLTSITNICQDGLLAPHSPWTCPGDKVFFDASVIWGLVGPKRIFGSEGNYSSMNWFFLGGALGPILVWVLHKAYPKQSWIPLINLRVLLGATGAMPPATPLNYNAWIIIETIFKFFVFRYRKSWWQRYNYILSATLDVGVAFMAVVLYFSLSMENKGVDWWGTSGEHCKLATCPTAKGIQVDGCPVH
ncbi:oligopeptide transporter 4 [Orobanche minor]